MDTNMVAFQLIAKAGDSFSTMIEALQKAKSREFDKSKDLIEEGKKQLAEAHNIHTQFLTAVAKGEKLEMNPIIVHAQDHLTKAIMAEVFIPEQIEMLKMIYELKER